MHYIKQLDSIRGIAVLLVILSHWVPISFFQAGAFIGVNTFFVLSGFLITNILLHNKDRAEALNHSKVLVLKNFFFRRALRIFPIYFLVVFTLYLLGEGRIHNINAEIGYLLSFTINFHFASLKYFGDFTAHLWSLAVEEQFYLVWPWLALCLPRKYLPVAIGLFILTGFTSQLFIKDHFDYLTTYSCLDAFGLGALLSWVYVYYLHHLKKTFRVFSVLVIVYVSFTILYLLNLLPILPPTRTLVSLLAVWLIAYIMVKLQANKNHKFTFLLNNTKLIFLGKISYGVYLYHFYIPYLGIRLVNGLQKLLPAFLQPYSFIFIGIGIFSLIIIFSWLSWRFIEMPIMRLKKYFEYTTPAPNLPQEKPAYKG